LQVPYAPILRSVSNPYERRTILEGTKKEALEMNAPYRISKTGQEDAAMQSLRDALGAVAIAPALAYSLNRADGKRWQLRRLDQREGESFETREAGFAAMRRAVVRSSAYCLVVEGCTGDLDVQFLNWDAGAARKFGVRP
jgi:hypothetical protein